MRESQELVAIFWSVSHKKVTEIVRCSGKSVFYTLVGSPRRAGEGEREAEWWSWRRWRRKSGGWKSHAFRLLLRVES